MKTKFLAEAALFGFLAAPAMAQPAWVPTGASASCHFDQSQNCWIDGTGLVPASSLLTESRSGTGTEYLANPAAGTVTLVWSPSALALDSNGLRVYQAQNMLLQSNTFSSTTWTKLGGSGGGVTPTIIGPINSITGPDAASSATEISFGATSTFGHDSYMIQTVSANVTPNYQYTCGAWIEHHSASGGGSLSDSIYLLAEDGTSPRFFGLGMTFVQPADFNWHYYSLTFTAFSSRFRLILGTLAQGGVGSGPINGGKFDIDFASCVPGLGTGTYAATTTSQVTAGSADTVTATGALATALAAANAVSITVKNASQMGTGSPGVAAVTLIDDNGTPLLGIDSSNHGVTGENMTLASSITGAWNTPETLSLSFGGSPTGTINLNGVGTGDTGSSRSATGPFTFGSTGGASNFCNCTIVSFDVYPSARTFPTSPPPIASVTVDYVTGVYRNTGCPADSFAVTTGAGGVLYSVVDDSSCTAYHPSMGVMHAGDAGAASSASNLTDISPATRMTTTNFGSHHVTGGGGNTWKGVGIISIPDGSAGSVLFYGASFQTYGGPASPYGIIQAAVDATIINDSATGAVTWGPLPGGSQRTLATDYSSPTFPNPSSANQSCGTPGFVQYGPNYAWAGPDNSNNFLYVICNAGNSVNATTSSWNNGDVELLARAPFSSILTSLGGAYNAAANAATWQFYNANGSGCGVANDPYNPNCWGAITSATPILAPSIGGQIGMTQPAYDQYSGQYVLAQWTFPALNYWGAGTSSPVKGQYGNATDWTIFTSRYVQGPYTPISGFRLAAFANVLGANTNTAWYEPTPIPASITQNKMNFAASGLNSAYYWTVVPMLKNY